MPETKRLYVLVGFHRYNQNYLSKALVALRWIPCDYEEGYFLAACQRIRNHLVALSQLSGFLCEELLRVNQSANFESMISPELDELFDVPLPEAISFMLRRIPTNRQSIRNPDNGNSSQALYDASI